MSLSQTTIKQAVSLEGTGIHTGNPVKLTFNPAPAGHGIKFRRTDLNNQPIIDAVAENVSDTERGTSLSVKDAKVMTVEHVLAATYGLGIDNLLIDINAVETPIMDGSSKAFTEILLEAGIETLEKERVVFDLDKPIEFYDEEKGVRLIALPSDKFKITVMIDYQSAVIGNQYAQLNGIEMFNDDFAGSRTFCFLHELEPLYKGDLIKGGTLQNAIVIVDKKVDDDELTKLSKLFNHKKVEVKEQGILSNVELNHPNEPARHKLLDVVGDLALTGFHFNAEIIANKPGHASNVAFAKKLRAYFKENKKKIQVPAYDPNKPPVYDFSTIEKTLPHKYPFLLVDKIIELSDKHVVGIKNVTFNEPFFQGHFPGNPVMPGVLQLEALAQTGGLLVLNTVDDPENYDTYFLKIDNAKFKNKVVPGDTLILKMELLSPIRRGLCEMKGTAFVGNKIASEAVLVAQIVRKENT